MPVKVVRRASSSVDQIRADIGARYINHRFDIAPETERARKRVHTSVQLDGLHIEHFECVGGQLSGLRPDGYEILCPLREGLRIARDGREAVGMPGSSLVSVGGASCRLTVEPSPGATVFSLTLSPDLLQAAGVGLLGEDFRLDVSRRFDSTKPAGQALARNMNSIYREMVELEKVGLAALAVPTYKELLANLSIAVLYPELLEARDARHTPSRLVDKAEEILRARVAEPLSIQEVADELGVTMRTLQLAFRKHRTYTPLQFLLSRRLMLARDRLLDPDLRSNVQSVAMSCGFLSMSKFSTRYRAIYGEMPSATLERGRRR